MRIVLVHMGDSEAIEKLIEKYGLGGVDRICDPERKLYQAFGLKRGRLRQLFGPKVLWRALPEGVLSRHGIGPPHRGQFPDAWPLSPRRIQHRPALSSPDGERQAGLRRHLRSPG